ncbi:MAG: LacI family transcriptional regulator [Acidobacteria bacterium]|nr:LacI family transcriptional regulator [Acidobacteriota bacterium]
MARARRETLTPARRGTAGTHAAAPRSASITRVAQRAGVSIATVSRVFADHPAVSEALRQRVRDAARALNYRPSRAARALRAGTSQAVGVVIPDLENPFFTAVVRGIEGVLQAAGYMLLLANSDEDTTREQRILETFRADGVAGVIFVPINGARHAYQDVLAPPLQVVAIDRSAVSLRTDLVTVDNVGGTRRGVLHLIGKNHRSVALLGGPSRHSTAKERERGYYEALRSAGLPIRSELIYHGDFREGGGYRGMKALLALPRRPGAVFVANNLMTLGAFRALHEAGVRVPGDLALVGFDDMPWATSLNPPLTAVSQPSHELGSSAADLLLDRIARPGRAVRHVMLDTTLVERASCGPATNQVPAPPATVRRSRR